MYFCTKKMACLHQLQLINIIFSLSSYCEPQIYPATCMILISIFKHRDKREIQGGVATWSRKALELPHELTVIVFHYPR